MTTKQVIYLSEGKLFAIPSVPRASTAPEELVSSTGNLSRLEHAFSPDSSEIALLVEGGKLVRASLDHSRPAEVIDGGPVRGGSLAYDGSGTRLLWLSEGESQVSGDVLRSAGVGGGAISEVATNVSAWWPVAGSGELLYLQSGVLRRENP